MGNVAKVACDDPASALFTGEFEWSDANGLRTMRGDPGRADGQYIARFDEKGRLISLEEPTVDGVRNQWIYRWDGQQGLAIFAEGKDKLPFIQIKFDDRGNWIAVEFDEEESFYDVNRVEREYDYDDQGNWIAIRTYFIWRPSDEVEENAELQRIAMERWRREIEYAE